MHNRLAEQCEPLATRDSRETYFVLHADRNAKIRAEVLDIKRLLRTEKEFQLWTPELKEPFPLSSAAAGQAMTKLTGSDFSCGEPCDREGFIALAEAGGVTVATVDKRRHGYHLGNCLLEFAEVSIDGRDRHTVAVESEDLAQAASAARTLGIDDLPNESYPVAIRRVLEL